MKVLIANNSDFYTVLLGIYNFFFRAHCEKDWSFPKDFLIGAASAAYQVEGGWNASGTD